MNTPKVGEICNLAPATSEIKNLAYSWSGAFIAPSAPKVQPNDTQTGNSSRTENSADAPYGA